MAILEEAAMMESGPPMGAAPPMGADPMMAGGQMPMEQEVMQLLELRTQIDERLAMLTGAPPPGDPAMMDPAMAGGMPAGPPMAPPMPPAGGLLG